jgi:VWFA-related protein
LEIFFIGISYGCDGIVDDRRSMRAGGIARRKIARWLCFSEKRTSRHFGCSRNRCEWKCGTWLTEKEFSVKEDNKKQKILSFDIHDLTPTSDFVKVPPLPPNTFINAPAAPESGPLYVLLLDLVNTEMDDEAYARKQLLKFIQGKPDGTRFAVFVLTDKLRLAEGFTDNKERLYALLDPAHPTPHIPRIFLYQQNSGRSDTGAMISVMTFIGRYLDGLPGRKNLIWFAGGFPLNLFPDQNDSADSQSKVKTVLNTLSQNQIAIYPVDIRGVVITDAHAPGGNTGGGGVTSDFRTGGGAAPPTAAAGLGNAGYSLANSSFMKEDEIARVTGGRAFYDTNDLAGALLTATEDGGEYCTLTYAPTNEKYDGMLRKIQVDFSKKGYHLAYRRSYYAEDPDDSPFLEKSQMKQDIGRPAARKLGDSLFTNMEHGAPLSHQLYFRVHIKAEGKSALASAEQMANLENQPAFFRVRKKNHALKPLSPIPLQTYAIEFTMMALAKSGQSGAKPPALEIATAAFDEDGQMLNGEVGIIDPAQSEVQAGGVYRALQEIDVPTNAKFVRVAVRDITNDHIGAMEISLPLVPNAESQTTATRPSNND